MRSRRGDLAGVVAAGASAAALWFGTGLHPVAGLTWFATLPMLLVAPALRARRVWLLALVAAAAGLANLWQFAVDRIEAPVPVVVGLIAIEALSFALVVSTFRALVVRRRPGWAALAAPAVAVAVDYLLAASSPHGTFTSLAYTQAGTPLLPLVAITGGWGVVACLHAVPAAVAATCWQLRHDRSRLPRAAGAALVLSVLATLLTPFVGRLVVDGGGRTVRVAAVSVPVPGDDPARVGTVVGDRVLAGDVAGVRAAAKRGAEVVVLAEAGLRVDRSEITDVGHRLGAAVEPSVPVLAGMHVVEPDETVHNEAVLFVAGRPPVEYRKQHLVPSVEAAVTPGDEAVVEPVDGTRVGLMICKDLDFPWTVRETVREGAGLMLVPAWDFQVDGWMHSRMALVRGAENGVAMVRSGRTGRVTISDVRGHVVAEGDTGKVPTQVVVSSVRVGDRETPYTRLGDWLPWLALLATGACLVVIARNRRVPS